MSLKRIIYGDNEDVWKTKEGKVVNPKPKGGIYLTDYESLTEEGYVSHAELGVEKLNLKDKVNTFNVSKETGKMGFNYFFVDNLEKEVNSYKVTTARSDVPEEVYDRFEAKNDEVAKIIFEERYAKKKSLSWDHLELLRIDQEKEEKTTFIDSRR